MRQRCEEQLALSRLSMIVIMVRKKSKQKTNPSLTVFNCAFFCSHAWPGILYGIMACLHSGMQMEQARNHLSESGKCVRQICLVCGKQKWSWNSSKPQRVQSFPFGLPLTRTQIEAALRNWCMIECMASMPSALVDRSLTQVVSSYCTGLSSCMCFVHLTERSCCHQV